MPATGLVDVCARIAVVLGNFEGYLSQVICAPDSDLLKCITQLKISLV